MGSEENGDQDNSEVNRLAKSDQTCGEDQEESSKPLKDSVDVDTIAGDSIQCARATAAKDDLGSTSTHQMSRAINVYDDEIWEDPGEIMED